MVKAEKAQELTKKLKRLGQENQVEDEIEKADNVAGLGFKLNAKLFDKLETHVVDPNKNFYRLDGENTQELDSLRARTREQKLSRRISKKPAPEVKQKLNFVRRKKGERRERMLKVPKGKKMN